MKTKLKATVSLIKGMHFLGKNSDGKGADMDSRHTGEPMEGAAPMELMLQAAGGCTAMDAIYILRKRRLEPEIFEVKLEGIERKEHPRIYENIDVVYRAKGPGITIEELEKAASLSINKYCSIFGMLRENTEINWRCELIDG